MMARDISITGSGKLAALGMALVVLLSVGAYSVAAGHADELTYEGDGDTAPNPTFDIDERTVAKHPMSQGASDEAMAGYYTDDGEWVDGADAAIEVNTTEDRETGDNVNPYTFDPVYIEDDSFGEFPRKGEEDNDASALDASEWSTTGTLTASDTTVAQNVDAVNFGTNGSMTAGDTVDATYNNWTSELDSDESKRVLQVGYEVNSQDSGVTAELVLTDESGDTKTYTLDNSTGTHVDQVKLNTISTSGGGSWDNIESAKVRISDEDADVSVAWLDLEKKGKTTLGVERVDSDSDGTYDETNEIFNSTGTISVHSMTTLDSQFDDASITDVKFPAQKPVSEMDLEEGEENGYVAYWEDADQYPAYEKRLNASYKINVTDNIDVSNSDVDLVLEQGYPDSRYETLGFESGVASGDNLSQASLTSRTGSLAQPDDEITIISGYTVGDDVIFTAETLHSQEEADNIQSTSGGAAAPPEDDSDDGIMDYLMTGVMVIAGLFGIRRWVL